MRILIGPFDGPEPRTNGIYLNMGPLLAEVKQNHEIRYLGYRMPTSVISRTTSRCGSSISAGVAFKMSQERGRRYSDGLLQGHDDESGRSHGQAGEMCILAAGGGGSKSSASGPARRRLRRP
jgi:hypothetical protein